MNDNNQNQNNPDSKWWEGVLKVLDYLVETFFKKPVALVAGLLFLDSLYYLNGMIDIYKALAFAGLITLFLVIIEVYKAWIKKQEKE